MLGIAIALQDCTFCVIHHILAAQYKKISHDIPARINKKPVTAEYQRCEMILFWVLLALNILFPLLEAVVLIPFNMTLYIKNETP